MRAAILLAIALAACDPTAPAPVWVPGMLPLTVWADSDATWEAVEAGCEAWRVTGLRCRRIDGRDLAQLEVAAEVTPPGSNGIAEYRYGLDGWVWSVRLHPDLFAAGAAAGVAAHELGHALGIIDHLPPGHLMSAVAASTTPTTADLDALADAWGEAPWL